MGKSFFQDGISIRELIILSSIINIPINMILNFVFLNIMIQKLSPEFLNLHLNELIEYMLKSSTFMIAPYVIIVCFYFLNDRTADLLKVMLAKHSNNPTE